MLCRSVAEGILVDVERKRLYELPEFEAVQSEHHAKVCCALIGWYSCRPSLAASPFNACCWDALSERAWHRTSGARTVSHVSAACVSRIPRP